jgi:hypothetical protein
MAGGKGTTFAGQLLALIYNGTAISSPSLAQNESSTPLTNFYVALHTTSPGAGGTQTTNEAAYTSYARVAVARTSGGWTVTGASVSPAATITFPTATGGSETETYFSVGSASSGAGEIFDWGPLSSNIVVSNGVTPQLTTSTVITEA